MVPSNVGVVPSRVRMVPRRVGVVPFTTPSTLGTTPSTLGANPNAPYGASPCPVQVVWIRPEKFIDGEVHLFASHDGSRTCPQSPFPSDPPPPPLVPILTTNYDVSTNFHEFSTNL